MLRVQSKPQTTTGPDPTNSRGKGRNGREQTKRESIEDWEREAPRFPFLPPPPLLGALGNSSASKNRCSVVETVDRAKAVLAVFVKERAQTLNCTSSERKLAHER